MPPLSTTGSRSLAGLLLVIGLVPGGTALAQAPGGTDQSQAYSPKLETAPEIKNGKIAAVQGTAGAKGEKLAFGGLSILQPVAVTLIAQSGSEDLRLEIGKFTTDGPIRSGSTKGNGVCTFQFRTEGDVQIKVSSPEGPKPFRLVVWAGDEMTPALPPVVVPMKDVKAQEGAGAPGQGGSSLVMWVIAGALVLCAGLLAVMVFKRGRT